MLVSSSENNHNNSFLLKLSGQYSVAIVCWLHVLYRRRKLMLMLMFMLDQPWKRLRVDPNLTQKEK